MTEITIQQFEAILERAVIILTEKLRNNDDYHDPEAFEKLVEEVLRDESRNLKATAEPTFKPNAFPDIKVGNFGVEVKYTGRDKWTSPGNSIFEGVGDRDVDKIYVIFGKTGGTSEVRWSRYEDCISDVRVVRAPSFAIDMEGSSKLFDKIAMHYAIFRELDKKEKLDIICLLYTSPSPRD